MFGYLLARLIIDLSGALRFVQAHPAVDDQPGGGQGVAVGVAEAGLGAVQPADVGFSKVTDEWLRHFDTKTPQPPTVTPMDSSNDETPHDTGHSNGHTVGFQSA